MMEHSTWIPIPPPEGLSHNDLMPVMRKDGSLGIIKGPGLRAAEEAVLPWLAVNRPAHPVDAGGASVALTVGVCWEAGEGHDPGTPMVEAPDWDNVGKVVGDLLQRAKWIEDDRHVADGRVIKSWDERPGIYVAVEAIE